MFNSHSIIDKMMIVVAMVEMVLTLALKNVVYLHLCFSFGGCGYIICAIDVTQFTYRASHYMSCNLSNS